MTDVERRETARRILEDPEDSFFWELSYEDLQDFYNTRCRCEAVPTTACCANDEARRIIGEPEASKIVLRALGKR